MDRIRGPDHTGRDIHIMVTMIRYRKLSKKKLVIARKMYQRAFEWYQNDTTLARCVTCDLIKQFPGLDLAVPDQPAFTRSWPCVNLLAKFLPMHDSTVQLPYDTKNLNNPVMSFRLETDLELIEMLNLLGKQQCQTHG